MSICYHSSVQEGPPFFVWAALGPGRRTIPALEVYVWFPQPVLPAVSLEGHRSTKGPRGVCPSPASDWTVPAANPLARHAPVCLLTYTCSTFPSGSDQGVPLPENPWVGLAPCLNYMDEELGRREVRWLTENRSVSKRQSCDLNTGRLAPKPALLTFTYATAPIRTVYLLYLKKHQIFKAPL